MKQSVRNRLTGLISIILLVTLSLSILKLRSMQVEERGFYLNLKFNFLNNLQVKAPVLLNGGMQVGEVHRIYQEKLQTYVRIYLDNRLRETLPRNYTSFSIFSDGLLGQKFVNITITEPSSPAGFYESEDIIEGLSPLSVDQMLMSFTNTLEESGADNIGAAIFADLKRLNRNTALIMNENEADYQKINQTIEESFTRIEKQYAEVTENLLKALGMNDEATSQSWVELMNNLESINASSDELRKALKKGTGSIARIRKSKKLERDTEVTMKLMRVFVDCIQNKPWVLMYKESCA